MDNIDEFLASLSPEETKYLHEKIMSGEQGEDMTAEMEEPNASESDEYTNGNVHVRMQVDIIGDASIDRYENALGAVIRDEGVDGALVILTPQSMTDVLGTAEAIAPRE